MSISHLVFLIFTAAALENALSDTDTLQKELAALEGEWSMVSGEREGVPLTADYVKGARRVTRDGETILTLGGQESSRATYTIDFSKKPKAIDLTLTDGPHKGKKQLGIYEVTGDML